jgi:hypothetical protein
MKKMQRSYLKILLVFIALIITCFQLAQAQVSSFRLKTADSLYQSKRFTQSFEHYREILKQKQYSPAMLLKMAYIQEGLANIGEAMYYLNLYFLVTNDKAVQDKMEELAEKYNLQGYETTDADRVLTFYQDFYPYITYATAALIILFLASAFYTRGRLHRRPVVSAVFLMIFVTAFFVHLNFGSRVKTGIIASTSTYIMDGPSPGASLIEITGDGHRVEVIGKHDVWLKIKWHGNTAYIKEQSLLPVQL